MLQVETWESPWLRDSLGLVQNTPFIFVSSLVTVEPETIITKGIGSKPPIYCSLFTCDERISSTACYVSPLGGAVGVGETLMASFIKRFMRTFSTTSFGQIFTFPRVFNTK